MTQKELADKDFQKNSSFPLVIHRHISSLATLFLYLLFMQLLNK